MKESLSQVHLNNSRNTQRHLAKLDFFNSLKKHRLWRLLAWQNIQLRYKRSILGPLWVTLTMAITIGAMGIIYSELFGINRAEYFPYLASGMISWNLIANLIRELSSTFTTAEARIHQIHLPYFLYINLTVWRNYIVYVHNIIVWAIVIAIYHSTVQSPLYFLLELPALAVMYVIANSTGMLLAIAATRFRDIDQIIKNLLQVLFFMTPVMWNINHITSPKVRAIIQLNPLYAFVDFLRAPLLGTPPSRTSIEVVLSIAFVSMILCYFVFIRYRKSIIFWL